MAGRRTVVFVNNMPDGAFVATERQFLGLLEAGAHGEPLSIRCYTMPGVPRGDRTTPHIAAHYRPLEAIWDDQPDLLIVTGSEPLSAAIEDEPYWEDLVRLLSWGRDRLASMLLSCLSAHAALATFDGVVRTRLPAKCTGVFPQDADRSHPLARDLASPLVLPHSRLNAVPVAGVAAAGYDVVVQSDETGWGLISKRVGDCNVVLVQGHPEYDPSSLLREYHRDLKRYLNHERDELPRLPLHCAAPGDWEALERLQERVADGERTITLAESFPFDQASERAPWPWREAAITLYANWLNRRPTRSP